MHLVCCCMLALSTDDTYINVRCTFSLNIKFMIFKNAQRIIKSDNEEVGGSNPLSGF